LNKLFFIFFTFRMLRSSRNKIVKAVTPKTKKRKLESSKDGSQGSPLKEHKKRGTAKVHRDKAENQSTGIDSQRHAQIRKKLKRAFVKKTKPPLEEPDKLLATPEVSKRTFASLGLRAELVDACNALGFKNPTPIQVEAIPVVIGGRDVVGLAETGSGKTAAFALPVLQHLYETPQKLHTLVLSPTRELAVQISEQFEALGSGIGLKCCCIIGGIDRTDQAVALAKRPHVVIGTPGRVLDHFENTKGFKMKYLKFLIFDEADRLLNLEFEKEINALVKIIPKEDRRTLLFSATMTTKVRKLQRAALVDPVKLEVNSKYTTVKTLLQKFIFKPAKFKDVYLFYVLSELGGKTVMIFVNTIRNCERLSIMLRSLGMGATRIHGNMNQNTRLGALNLFKTGEREILLCTDVASRGLDIPSVDVVVNYDIPLQSKNYIHRVGRTARAGRRGLAINIVCQYDVELYLRIEELIKQKLEEFKTPEEEVMVLYERVEEAQRIANIEMKEMDNQRKKRKKGNKKSY